MSLFPTTQGRESLVKELTNRVRLLEHQLKHASQALIEAQQRAERAEHSTQEAWQFARTIMRTGRASR